VTTLSQVIEIEQQIEGFAESVMGIVNQLNEEGQIKIGLKLSDPPAPLETSLDELFEELSQMVDPLPPSGQNPIFCYGIDLTTDTNQRGVLYLLIDGPIASVIYLDSNDPEITTRCLEVLSQILSEKNLQMEIFFESPRHLFIADNTDVFLGILAQSIIEYGQQMDPIDVLKILAYGNLPFTSMVDGSDGAEGDYGGIGDEVPGRVGEGQGIDDYDDDY
jgi:hypothetical protein